MVTSVQVMVWPELVLEPHFEEIVLPHKRPDY